MRRHSLFCIAALFAAMIPMSASAQLIVDGLPNVDDDRLYSWLDGADFLGADGIAETPVWPNRQGDEDRAIWSGFGVQPFELAPVLIDGVHPGGRYSNVVTWTNVDRFGILEESFTVFVVAAVRDPSFAYFFTGNQGGGGTEANANFFDNDIDTELDTWTLKGNDNGFDRVYTAPVETDVLQMHAFTYGDEMAWHHLNGELAGEGEIGYASLEGFVLGGRQNGNERATVDFAEVLIFSEALSDADRQAVEGYLSAKYFGTGNDPGDFDGDGMLTAADIDLLSAAVRDGSTDTQFDVDGDGSVASADRTYWVNDLKQTYMGDANLDGEFNSGDMVTVFTVGQYEDGIAGNSGWSQGDWNGDGEFDSSDFVVAFAAGGYEQGPRAAVASVPEPSSIGLLMLGGLALLARCRLRR